MTEREPDDAVFGYLIVPFPGEEGFLYGRVAPARADDFFAFQKPRGNVRARRGVFHVDRPLHIIIVRQFIAYGGNIHVEEVIAPISVFHDRGQLAFFAREHGVASLFRGHRFVVERREIRQRKGFFIADFHGIFGRIHEISVIPFRLERYGIGLAARKSERGEIDRRRGKFRFRIHLHAVLFRNGNRVGRRIHFVALDGVRGKHALFLFRIRRRGQRRVRVGIEFGNLRNFHKFNAVQHYLALDFSRKESHTESIRALAENGSAVLIGFLPEFDIELCIRQRAHGVVSEHQRLRALSVFRP